MKADVSQRVVYEDNHVIVVCKESGEIVQGDKTGDRPLSDLVKEYIKEKYGKPGAVFLGVVHRIDRPVAGLVLFARTSKALSRLNVMIGRGEISKTYWALTGEKPPEEEGEIESWLIRNEKQNKSYSFPDERKGSKRSLLRYRVLGKSDRYFLLEIKLLTGRHHQIRSQLAYIGCPIRGDLKYGARRSLPDGSISLFSKRLEFTHPVSKKPIILDAPFPSDPIWKAFEGIGEGKG